MLMDDAHHSLRDEPEIPPARHMLRDLRLFIGEIRPVLGGCVGRFGDLVGKVRCLLARLRATHLDVSGEQGRGVSLRG